MEQTNPQQPKTPEPKKVWNNQTYIEDRFRIYDKRGKLVPFILNKAQRYYMKLRRRRNLILKARQKGITKIIDADQLVDTMRIPHTQAVVISHEKVATQRLFSAVKDYVKNMKLKPTVSIDSKSEIFFPFKGSSYFVGTAGSKAFGRGDTIARAHLSEAAFYPDLKRMLDGIEEACEFGRIDIESTPNGRDDFYDLWQKAKEGRSSYTPIFIPWYIDGEYSVENLTEKEILGMSDSVRQMFNMPDEDFEKTVTDQEKAFRERVKKEYGIEITTGMLKWRRYKIWDKGDTFYQEYPEDDVSCFLQSGRSVFKTITTDITRRVPLDDFDNWNADKKTKQMLEGRLLYAGLDGAVGTEGGDNHSFAVMDVPDPSKNEAVIIYEYTSNEPSEIFDSKVAKICERFKIHLGVEDNGVGQVHVKELRRLGIGFTEWTTGGTNRPVMISELETGYRKGEIIETYPEAENEARDMIYKGDRAEHQTGKHDDRIFARAIANGMRNLPESGIEFL